MNRSDPNRSLEWAQVTSLLAFLDAAPVDGASGTLETNAEHDAFRGLVERIGLPAAVYRLDGGLQFVWGGDPADFPETIETEATASFGFMHHDGALLAVRQLPDLSDFPGVTSRRLSCIALRIEVQSLAVILGQSDAPQTVTQAEFRLLAMLMTGMTLEEAAQSDGAAYNTRRKQLQSVTAKLGVSRQSELILLIAQALSGFFFDRLSFPPSKSPDLQVLQERYGRDLRVHDIAVGKPDRLRVCELGPIDGKPVLLFHPLLFPVLPLPNQLHTLLERNVRLLIPLRPKYCGSGYSQNMAPSPTRLTSEFANSVCRMIRLFNLEQVPVISVVWGAAWASQLAHSDPGNLVGRIVFVSAPAQTTEQSGFRSFLHAMMPLLKRTPLAAELLVKLHATRMRSEDLVTRGFLKTFSNSAADTATMNSVLTEGWIQALTSKVLRHSETAIANELRVQTHDWTKTLAGLNNELVFIHGDDDQMSPWEELKPVVDRLPQANFELLRQTGQLLYLDQFDRVLRHV